MKKLLGILVIVALSLAVVAIPVSALSYVAWYENACDDTHSAGTALAFHLDPDETLLVNGFAMELGGWSSTVHGSNPVGGELFEVEWNAGSSRWDVVGTYLFRVTDDVTYADLAPYPYVGFVSWHPDEPVLMEADKEYVFQAYAYSGSSSDYLAWFYESSSINAMIEQTGGDWDHSNNYFSEAAGGVRDVNFIVYGSWYDEPACETLDYELMADNTVVLSGIVTSIGEDSAVQTYIDISSWDDMTDPTEYDTGVYDEIGIDGIFELEIDDVPYDTTFYYQARVVGLQSEIENEGEILDFEIDSASDLYPIIECELTENSADRTTFDIMLVDLGQCSSGTVNLHVSADGVADLKADPTEIEIATGVTEPTLYRYINTTSFTDGVLYHYRAEFDDGASIQRYSDIRSFTRWDADKSGMENWLIEWLDKFNLGGGTGGLTTLDWFWWLICIAIFGFTLFIGYKTRAKWVPIVGGLLVAVLLVLTGIVDIWLLVLIAIVGGFIIFKVMFPRMGGA